MEKQHYAVLCYRVHPHVQFALFLALGSYQGLRLPTEAVMLKWVDVDFEAGTMENSCAKNERFADHETIDSDLKRNRIVAS